MIPMMNQTVVLQPAPLALSYHAHAEHMYPPTLLLVSMIYAFPLGHTSHVVWPVFGWSSRFCQSHGVHLELPVAGPTLSMWHRVHVVEPALFEY